MPETALNPMVTASPGGTHSPGGSSAPGAAGTLLTVTDATFADVVLAERLPVLVDFWAQWCPLAGTLAELAAEFAGRAVIAKLDVDANPETTRAYRILSMPTLTFFRAGTVTGTLVGARPKNELRAALLTAVEPYANR